MYLTLLASGVIVNIMINRMHGVFPIGEIYASLKIDIVMSNALVRVASTLKTCLNEPYKRIVDSNSDLGMTSQNAQIGPTALRVVPHYPLLQGAVLRERLCRIVLLVPHYPFLQDAVLQDRTSKCHTTLQKTQPQPPRLD